MKCKADSRMISPWLFLVLGLIGFVIVLGVFSYFSKSTDVRLMEARALNERLVYGISEGGHLKDKVFTDFDILKESGIDKKVIEDSGKFYFNISIYKDGELKAVFLKGNEDFEVQCRLRGERLARCYYREFFLIGKDNTIYKIEITSGAG